jgi:hypothetical protein
MPLRGPDGWPVFKGWRLKALIDMRCRSGWRIDHRCRSGNLSASGVVIVAGSCARAKLRRSAIASVPLARSGKASRLYGAPEGVYRAPGTTSARWRFGRQRCPVWERSGEASPRSCGERFGSGPPYNAPAGLALGPRSMSRRSGSIRLWRFGEARPGRGFGSIVVSLCRFGLNCGSLGALRLRRMLPALRIGPPCRLG